MEGTTSDSAVDLQTAGGTRANTCLALSMMVVTVYSAEAARSPEGVVRHRGNKGHIPSQRRTKRHILFWMGKEREYNIALCQQPKMVRASRGKQEAILLRLRCPTDLSASTLPMLKQLLTT
jgi:hypothetical protein